jgi:hypothetical protein
MIAPKPGAHAAAQAARMMIGQARQPADAAATLAGCVVGPTGSTG